MAQDPIASLVECAICINRFHETDNLRSPRRLPCCGKICCQTCVLQTKEKQQGMCPYCRQDILDNNEDLPLCRVTLDLLASLCNMCSSSQSLQLCSHCHRNYCSVCHSSHLRSVHNEALEACQQWIADRRVEIMSARVGMVQALEELCERAESELDLMENSLLLVKMRISSIADDTGMADSADLDLGCEAMKSQSRYHLQRVKDVQDAVSRAGQRSSAARAGETLGSTKSGHKAVNHTECQQQQQSELSDPERLQLADVTGLRKVGHQITEHRIFSMTVLESGGMLLAEKSRLWHYDVDSENGNGFLQLADQRVIPLYHKYQGWCTAITATAEHVILAISHYRRSANVIICLSLRELALLGVSSGEDSSPDGRGGFFFVQALAVDVVRGRLFAVETSAHKVHALSYPSLAYQCLTGDSSTLRSPTAVCVTRHFLLVAGVHGLALFDADHPDQHLRTMAIGGLPSAVQPLICLDIEQEGQQQLVLCIGKNRACLVLISDAGRTLDIRREDLIPVSGELLVAQTEQHLLIANRNSTDVQLFEYVYNNGL